MIKDKLNSVKVSQKNKWENFFEIPNKKKEFAINNDDCSEKAYDNYDIYENN